MLEFIGNISGVLGLIFLVVGFLISIYFFFRVFGKKLNNVNFELVSKSLLNESNKLGMLGIIFTILFVLSLVFSFINIVLFGILFLGIIIGLVWSDLELISEKWS